MPRRGTRAGADAPKGKRARQIGPTPLNAPFRGLRSRLDSRKPAPPSEPPPASRPTAAPAVDDDALFRHAMEGVDLLAPSSRVRIERPAPTAEPRRPVPEDAEALAALSDLVSGDASFDVSETREYVEGHVVGIDPRLVRRLRRGDFARQAHLDLHGMVAAEAHVPLQQLVTTSVADGLP
jgi:hypothetical protein